MHQTVKRKSEHLDIVVSRNVANPDLSTGLQHVRFEHVALPELDLDDIDLATEFLGRRIKAPFLISSMTGGPEAAADINRAIAAAAARAGIALAIGSQRVALESGGAAAGLDRSLRALAPDVPILANFGAAQLLAWSDPIGEASRAVEMIDADGLIVHLNPLQEAVQAEGDRKWAGIRDKLQMLAAESPVPVIVKEIGCGISGPVATDLWAAGVRIIDVAGAGGTSWAAVEAERAPDEQSRAVADAFRGWGIPTAECIAAVRQACPEATIIASGGIRTGLDAARAIRLGADLVGQAAGLLQAALSGADPLIRHLETMTEQLRIACFCTGSRSLAELRKVRLLGASETPPNVRP